MVFNRPVITARSILVALVGLTILAAGCGSSSSSMSSSGSASLVTIFITNGLYSPNPLTVKAGQNVNWKNNDSIAHTATLAGAFDTGSIAPTSAADVPVAMNTTGTFNYHCTLHSAENGLIVVQP
jgi:plastocyanin